MSISRKVFLLIHSVYDLWHGEDCPPIGNTWSSCLTLRPFGWHSKKAYQNEGEYELKELSVLTYLLKGERTSEWWRKQQSRKVSVCDASWERFQHASALKGRGSRDGRLPVQIRGLLRTTEAWGGNQEKESVVCGHYTALTKAKHHAERAPNTE